MKKIVLLFAVGFAVVSCGKKGWDAASEKEYMDICTKEAGAAATAGCACSLEILKAEKVAPDAPESALTPAIKEKITACTIASMVPTVVDTTATTAPTDTTATTHDAHGGH